MLANTHWPAFYLAAGITAVIPYVLVTLVIEATALRFSRVHHRRRPDEAPFKPRWGQALWWALLANLASAVFGDTCFAYMFFVPEGYLLLLVHFITSCVVEITVYGLLLSPVSKRLVAAVAVGNATVYFVVALAYAVEWLPKLKIEQ